MKTSLSAKPVLALASSIMLACLGLAGVSALAADTPTNAEPNEAIARIKEQGLTTNSQIMATLSYLSDVIGERLTGSRIAACCIIALGAACVGWRF